ncbi:MAG: GSCFA domain-containing protein, partial [Bacteroidota bacterium]|nr:GSCFA domain-containing protein [Bacteroidota bacterium]
TALTYWYKPFDRLMGNCHKIDNKLIERRLISYLDIANKFYETIREVRKIFNKQHNIVFTVSPIRHWREGYRDNLVSKSHLHLAIEEMRKKDENLGYFPSYELVMDTLRDYRFYAEDMLHINSTAVDYIWQQFSNTYFTPNTMELNKQFFRLWTMKNHRPLNPDTLQYKMHLEKIKTEIDRLQVLTALPLS